MDDDEPTAAAVADMFAAARRGQAVTVLAAVRASPKLLGARDDVNRWTVLHIFARLSMVKPVQQLLELGADVESRDALFRSPLLLAARADASAPKLVAAEAEALPPPPPELEAKVRVRMIEQTLAALLRGGARVTARDNFGLTALHHAAQAGQTEAVKFLLSLNTALSLPRAPLEAETNAEERPLHLAAAGGHTATVRTMLAAGAHHGKTNYLGQTALHLAVAAGDTPAALATVAEMIKPEWRADLSPAAADGTTPLHVAAAGGHDEMVRALLHARNVKRNGGGRSVELEPLDRAGRDPAAVAREAGFDDVVSLLEVAARAAAEHKARAAAEQDAALRAAFATKASVSARPAMPEVPEEGAEAEDEEPLSMQEYEARRAP